MPLLSAWSVSSTHDARNAGRSRFQLDAPIIAGRSFFEMVTFMLDELKILEQEVIDRGFKNFGPSQSRYRYVYELFIAALLCYTNKFGDEDVDEVRNRLFAWAYALRVELLRVQFVSADNRARGKNDANKSPFVLLRNAMTGSVVRKLPITSKPYSDNHEKELVAFYQGAAMSKKELKPELLTVGKLFTDNYLIPIYQRNYAWRAEQIEQLISDIQDSVVGAGQLFSWEPCCNQAG